MKTYQDYYVTLMFWAGEDDDEIVETAGLALAQGPKSAMSVKRAKEVPNLLIIRGIQTNERDCVTCAIFNMIENFFKVSSSTKKN